MSLDYRIIPVTPFEQNCSLIWCTETMRGALVDAGGDTERLQAAAASLGVHIEKLLLTHGHIDHAGGAGGLAGNSACRSRARSAKKASGSTSCRSRVAASAFRRRRPSRRTAGWSDGDSVSVGNETLAVIHAPGHTPGHVVFFHAPSKLAIVGDVLFAGSIGRTDFPRGNHRDLIASIRDKLWPLGDDVEFIPGHGPMSTFGEERRSNPFVADGA
jgi:hydroxyacylglutathione hydrolase